MNDLEDNPFDVDEASDLEIEPGTPEITSSGITQRLFDGSLTGPSISELKADYELPYHWAVAARGTIRTATGVGVPPVFEIVFGTAMGLVKTMNARKSRSPLDEEPGTEIAVNENNAES